MTDKLELAEEFREVSPEKYAEIGALPGAFIKDGILNIETDEGTAAIGYIDKTTRKHMVRVK
jgi:hypothetical protein